MQIPPNAALLNLVASLPAQGAAVAPPPAALKPPQPPVEQPAMATVGETRQTPGFLPRGSIINIVA